MVLLKIKKYCNILKTDLEGKKGVLCPLLNNATKISHYSLCFLPFVTDSLPFSQVLCT